VIVLMGVAGAGKSTVGTLVAARLGVPFLDADDFHDQSSIDAMRAGIALDDRQRQPWLHRLNRVLRAHQAAGIVLACSALKRSYRDVLREGLDEVLFVQLTVSEDVLAARLDSRAGHYAGPAILPSQVATLELGDDVVGVNGELPPEAVADEVVRIAAPPSSAPTRTPRVRDAD
jgi:carbohydrate kinase (thermoresistant glucokinase family)